MEVQEIDILERKISEGLKKSEKRMLLEKALKGESVVIDNGKKIETIPAKEVLRKRFGI